MKIIELIGEATKVTAVNPSSGEVTYKDDVTNVTTTVPKDAAMPVAAGTTEINTAKLQPSTGAASASANTSQLGVKVGDTVKMTDPTKAGTMGSPVTKVSEDTNDITQDEANEIMSRINDGENFADIADQYPQLIQMFDNIAAEHNYDPDADFEEILDIIMDDLQNIDKSDELDDITRLSGL